LPLTQATPLERNAKDTVAKELEMDIIFNRLRPGERLIEDDLMARFEQSRHRVRYAIDTLTRCGLAVRQANKGAHVCSYDYKQVIEIYKLRNILQEAAANDIRFPVAPEIITRLLILNEAQTNAIARCDLEEVFHLNNQFHRTVFSCCGNQELCNAIQVQARRTDPIRTNSFKKPGYLAHAHKEHHQMIQALSDGDRATLIALNRIHIERPKSTYIEKYLSDKDTPLS